MKKVLFEFVRYIMVGATATGVDYGAYYLLTRGFALGALTANPLAYFLGNIVSFIGHRLVTFRAHGNPVTQYVRFLCVTVVGLAISQLTIWFFMELGIHDLIAKAASVVISGLFNYLANRFWAFRKM